MGQKNADDKATKMPRIILFGNQTTKLMLYIFAGLPGSGKSTLAKKLAQKLGATYLRIDTIEQGLRDTCGK